MNTKRDYVTMIRLLEMQPFTRSIIRKELEKFKSFDVWSVDSFFQDSVDYIKARRHSSDITLEEARELAQDVRVLRRYFEEKSPADAWVVQKYAAKACEYQIKIYNAAISGGL